MMATEKLSGLKNLRAHYPALRTRTGTAGVLAAALGVVAATTGFFLLVDKYFAEWLPDGEIVILALGFLILSRFFSRKDRYAARFGEAAYGRAFTSFAIPGLGIIIGAIAHLAYMPGPLIPDLWWKPVLMGLGWLALLIGVLLWWRAVNTLGLDYLMMLYVYFPAERRVVNAAIYQVIRHPIYAATLHIGTGLALVHAGWYSLLTSLILQLFFWGWIRLVEEPELLRQVPGYKEYRLGVAAFAPRLRHLGPFWRLLLGGAVD
jgi:protein-S-isoprenylcysteine O-methyltransferase Ste14